MKKFQFFTPTPKYKEYFILDLLSKDEKLSQRDIALFLNVSIAMINSYLTEYEKNGYLNKIYLSKKIVHYKVTEAGIERIKFLNIAFLESSLDIYKSAKTNIDLFIERIVKDGYKHILMYGAGEVAEIMLQVIKNDYKGILDVVAIIDDNIDKQGKSIVNTPIISLNDIRKYNCDGILVSSYISQNTIKDKLIQINYDEGKIINFFQEEKSR